MNRRILYWKWDESILKTDIKKEVQDLIDRCTLDTIYLKYDSMKPSISYKDEKLKELIFITAKMLNESGKSLWLDVDPRGETESFLKRYPGKEGEFLCFFETELDENGQGTIKVPYLYDSCKDRIRMRNAWVINKIGNCCFEDDGLRQICPVVEYGKDELIISLKADKKYSNFTFVIAVTIMNGKVDVFSKEVIEYSKEMINYFSELPICGMGTDEWGTGVDCDIEDGVWVCKKFSFSENLKREFEKNYHIDFFENAIYMAYKSKKTEQFSNDFISKYITLIRRNLCHSNDEYYKTVKTALGEKALIGVHPTYWGDAYDFTFDAIANGFHWWEMKRDFAQTDEEVSLSIRLALSRKCGDNVWYNMWYGMRSPHLMSFYSEAWKDLRFGGKVHYLGWDTKYEPWHCFFKYQNGEIEQINAMEEKIEEAFLHIKSVPDSSVLIVFGIEAVTNWLRNFGQAKIIRGKGRLTKVLMLVQGIFNACNCDMVPSSEIDNGSVKIKDGKVCYFNQKYDSILFVYPEMVSRKVSGFMHEYSHWGKLFVVGDGAEEYSEACQIRNDLPEASWVIKEFQNTGINFHRVGRGVEFRDGSIVFTAMANLPINNYFEEEFEINNKKYSFKGYDYLIINPGQATAYFDKNSSLVITEK